MNKTGASLRLGLLAAAIGVVLSGCNNASGGSADVPETIVGIASDGIGLANTTVDIVDSKSHSITGIATDTNGRFQFHTGTYVFPFMITVKANGQSYYSLVTESDRQVNINAATTAIAQMALGTTQLSTAYATASFKKLTAAKLAEAESLYLRAMREDSLLGASLFDVSPRTKDYNPGNALADGDAYQQYMAMVEPSISALDGRLLLLNKKPYRFSNYNTVTRATSDDLLTAGLDDVGMRGAAPGYPSSIGQVSATELRRNGIYNAYHALTDLTFAGGYGSLWSRVSKVPGVEYLGYSDTGDGSRNVSTLVQIPDSFDKQHPCLVVVPSTNLSGVYAANPTAEWGLLHGCAIAVTDKGAGNGAEYIDSSSSYEIDGIIGSSQGTTNTLQFKTGYPSDVRLPFIAQYPGRFAFKYSHSKLNPEKSWGQNTLDAAKFAFYLLNERYGQPSDVGDRKLRAILPENTTVILAGDSEGASAAIAALEQDILSFFDGAVLAQPSAQTNSDNVSIQQGGVAVMAAGKSLLDYITYANLYQPCAALAVQNAPGAATVDAAAAANRCEALKQKGLLTSVSLSAQAAEAQQNLLAYGWQSDSAELHGSAYVRSIAGYATGYLNAYAKAGAPDNLCDISYAMIDGAGAPIDAPLVKLRTLFADGNGMPPYGDIQLINNVAVGGARQWSKAVSPSTGLVDYSFDSAYCMRGLALGKDPVSGVALVDKEIRDADGKLLSKDLSGTWSANIAASSNEVKLTAALQGKPAIILHGRSDPLFPVNHSSRPFVAKSLATDGVRSKLRYYEVLNAQHWDAANATAGFDSRYVPLRPYLQQSLDLMYAHLTLNQALPQSQVLRTVPRGGTPGSAPAITTSNAPPIALVPAAGDVISFSGSTLSIPN